MNRYSRKDLLRILRIHPRQLAAWERAGLAAQSDDYSFDDLVQLRKLRDLSATRISVRSIRNSVDAMQRVAGMVNPLREAGAVVRRGSRLVFRHSGALMEPLTRQLFFDFEQQMQGQAVLMTGNAMPAQRQNERFAQAQEIFLRAVQMEDDVATLPRAQELYEDLLQMQPMHAAGCINLGTIYYNQRQYEQAESLYRHATVADPEYALAFFDLGNVLDELQRLPEAVEAYKRAVALVPGYADAHYNLALTYERVGEKRKALPHWLAYVRLDPVGPWAAHARGQAKRILATEKLCIVTRHGRLVSNG